MLLMNILTVNTGSSSVRLALFKYDSTSLTKIRNWHFKNDEGSPEDLLKKCESELNAANVISHRVVHGGTKLINSHLITEKTETEIEKLSPLAPLHNPIALKWISACRSLLGHNIPQVAVYDTSFYVSLPDIAKTYALPGELCDQYKIMRYGFHGLAHKAMTKRWQEIQKEIDKGGRIITLQLGSGCSVTAVNNGNPVDTSMGFSPLEGLVMSTRSGDLDPGILIYLQKHNWLTVDDLDRMLNKSSGLFGVSGISGDVKELLSADAPAARLSLDLYCYRAKKYIGSYMASLGGVDAILFGGGVGENSPVIRSKILENMKWCGIEINEYVNSNTIGTENRISSQTAKVEVWVIPVDEASVLAQEAVKLLTVYKKNS